MKTPANRIIECIHVLRQETLADDTESFNLFRIPGHQFRPSERNSRTILEGERSVFGPYRRSTLRYGRQTYFRMNGKSIQLVPFRSTMEIPDMAVRTCQ